MSETEYNTDQGWWTGPNAEAIRRRVAEAGPSPDHWARFVALRAELFEAIARGLAEDGHCKSYEGALIVHLPNYFEERGTETAYGAFDRGAWVIELHCYLVGPNRHYRWEGRSFEEALHKAETDVRAWIAGDYRLRHDERF